MVSEELLRMRQTLSQYTLNSLYQCMYLLSVIISTVVKTKNQKSHAHDFCRELSTFFSLTHPPVEICTERCCALSRRIRSLFVWKSIYKGSLRILYTWTTFMFLFRGPANRSSYLLIRPKDQKMQMNFGMPFLPTFIPSCFLLMEAFLKNRELLSCI